jgi:hypothetical protein
VGQDFIRLTDPTLCEAELRGLGLAQQSGIKFHIFHVVLFHWINPLKDGHIRAPESLAFFKGHNGIAIMQRLTYFNGRGTLSHQIRCKYTSLWHIDRQ